MNIWEARPRNSKFLHKVEKVDDHRVHLKGVILFSDTDSDKDVKCWSHESDFPWFLTHPEESFNVKYPEQKFIIAATLVQELFDLRNGSVTIADDFVLRQKIKFWEAWREHKHQTEDGNQGTTE